MPMVTYCREAGSEPTIEEQEAARRRIEAAARRPYRFDPDCPLVTEAQAAEFEPVNGMTWEERAYRLAEADTREPLARRNSCREQVRHEMVATAPTGR